MSLPWPGAYVRCFDTVKSTGRVSSRSINLTNVHEVAEVHTSYIRLLLQRQIMPHFPVISMIIIVLFNITIVMVGRAFVQLFSMGFPQHLQEQTTGDINLVEQLLNYWTTTSAHLSVLRCACLFSHTPPPTRPPLSISATPTTRLSSPLFLVSVPPLQTTS